MGLAIVERIVNSHGRQVWVESEKGKGATFIFTLPKEIKFRLIHLRVTKPRDLNTGPFFTNAR